MKPRVYTHLTIQPPNEDGSCEVWAAYEEKHPQLGTFDTDGVIGFLYHLGSHWVWANEVGHPTMVFDTPEDLIGWLQAKSPSIDWAETYRQPENRVPR